MTVQSPVHRAAALLLAAGVLGACGGAPAPVAASPPAASPPPSSSHRRPSPSSAPSPDAPVALPWPAPGAAEQAALQAAVDGGAQPWLLDPSEVALAYAATAYGWSSAQAVPEPDGRTVGVHGAGGDEATLTLAQPGRTGQGGIWVVTAAHRG